MSPACRRKCTVQPWPALAVGKSGVAPGAFLYYFAVPTWKWGETAPWVEQLEKLIEYNKSLKDTPRFAVISISLGAFSLRPNFARWKLAVEQANETEF